MPIPALSNTVFTEEDSQTGIAYAICIATEVESIEWDIRSTDVDLKVNQQMVERSTNEIQTVEEGVTMHSTIRTSDTNQQLYVINSTLRVTPAFTSQGFIEFVCTSRVGPNTLRGTTTIFRSGDGNFESKCYFTSIITSVMRLKPITLCSWYHVSFMAT